MQNRFSDLLNLIEGDTALRMLELSGKRRDVVIEALRIAASSQLAPIEHATDNEKKIVGRLVQDLLAIWGVSISVNDGEEITVKSSTDADTIFKALGSTGEDYLIVHKTGVKDRWVRLIWGNDVDVISDYHVSLEPLMTGANALANELDS